MQLGAAQIDPTHTPLVQSSATLQACPPSQGPQSGPPQFRSVSSSSFSLLLQVSGAQRAAEQMLVSQSVSAPQILPIAQGLQPGPQSTSDSAPFLSSSSHLASAHSPSWQRRLLQSSS